MITNKRFVEQLLPLEMQVDGKSENFKELLGVYASTAAEGDLHNELAAQKLDISKVGGRQLDELGRLLYVYRKLGESDLIYRLRIRREVPARKASSTIPGLQELVNSIRLVPPTQTNYIRIADHPTYPATVHLSIGQDVAMEELAFILEAIETAFPAGVRFGVMLVGMDSWQELKDTFATWDDINKPEYQW